MESTLIKKENDKTRKLRKENNVEEICRIYQKQDKCGKCPLKT